MYDNTNRWQGDGIIMCKFEYDKFISAPDVFKLVHFNDYRQKDMNINSVHPGHSDLVNTEK